MCYVSAFTELRVNSFPERYNVHISPNPLIVLPGVL